MICIYHSRDLDGFSSGAIVKKWFESMIYQPDVIGTGELKLIGYDYGQPFPYEQITAGEKVVMIDVSLKMPEMYQLAQLIGSAENFIWIDHHISAINEYTAFMTENLIATHKGDLFLTPILENGIAACELGWKYFFPDQKMPWAIKLLGEYDTWRNEDKVKWENEILPFQFGMRSVCNSVDTFPMELLETTYVRAIADNTFTINKIIESGKNILDYQAMINEQQCRKAAFEIEFEGHRAICLNGGAFNSDVFKSVFDESKHDIMMPFQFDGKQWVISLYTTKTTVDCSAIAKSKGGGGHKQAAGFQVQDIKSIFPNM